MCYNCGCGVPNDDMGRKKVTEGGGSLTEDDFKHMAEEWGVSVEEAKRNTLETLQNQLKK